MKVYWRSLWDLILGPRCRITGDRVFPRDAAGHERDQHGTDGACW